MLKTGDAWLEAEEKKALTQRARCGERGGAFEWIGGPRI